MLCRQYLRFRILLSTVFYFLLLSPLNAKPLHYLYINAREGVASGGHTALRFNNEAFHFQHYDGGIIRLVKQASFDFDFQYRYLDNRTIHQATIELSEQHYAQLHKHFNLLFLQQRRQDDLLREINLNISLLQKKQQYPLLSIKGAGLLAINTAPEGIQASTIQSLQQQINQRYSDSFLIDQIQHLKEEIQTLHPAPWTEDSLLLGEAAFVAVPYSFASQHLDAIRKILFFKALKNGIPLNQQQYFIPEQSNFSLSKAELIKLKQLQNRLINNLINLLTSQRPDWGNVAFILYARILSLALAIDSGTFVFLDSYAANSFSIPYDEVETYRTLLQAQKDQALSKIIQQKQLIFTEQKVISEKQYSRFEMLSNYYYERERGLAKNRSIRVYGEQLLPTKPIALPNHLFPQLTLKQTETALHRLKHYQNEVAQQIQSIYKYNLFTRNCVTEIFDTINKANISDQDIDDIGMLAQHNLIAFIPFGSYDSLSADYPKQTLDSYRQQQLTKMYQEENNVLVYLREFNTLTASHYKFNDQDSTFLFFTDDKVWSRPLLGAFNLLTAVTISLYGSFKLPFDSGKTFKNGTMGILMSLPELAFFNIRKCSYKHLVAPIQSE